MWTEFTHFDLRQSVTIDYAKFKMVLAYTKTINDVLQF